MRVARYQARGERVHGGDGGIVTLVASRVMMASS